LLQRKTKIRHPHIDDNPELEQEEFLNPLAAASNEGSPFSDLYNTDDVENRLKYTPKAGQTVVEEEIYIPETD